MFNRMRSNFWVDFWVDFWKSITDLFVPKDEHLSVDDLDLWSSASTFYKERPDTIAEWFLMLPISVREKAFRNTKQEDLTAEIDSSTGALRGAFVWEESPEGFDYWNRVNEWLKHGDMLDHIEDD